MNDATQTDGQAQAPAMTEDEAKALAESSKRFQALRRRFIAPSALASESATIVQTMRDAAACGITPLHNYNPESDIPQGWGVGIIPIPKNRGTGQDRENVGVVVGIVPDFDTVMATEGGPAFVRETVTRTLLGKLANAMRPAVDGNAVNKLESVADFITNLRAADSLDGFNKVHGAVLDKLRESLKGLNKAKFRKCLEVAAYAEQQYPDVQQSQWEGVIGILLGLAEKASVDPGAMATWLDTRAAATVNAGTFDLDGLTAAMGEDDADDGEETSE